MVVAIIGCIRNNADIVNEVIMIVCFSIILIYYITIRTVSNNTCYWRVTEYTSSSLIIVRDRLFMFCWLWGWFANKPTIYNNILLCRNVYLFMYQCKKINMSLTAGCSRQLQIARQLHSQYWPIGLALWWCKYLVLSLWNMWLRERFIRIKPWT